MLRMRNCLKSKSKIICSFVLLFFCFSKNIKAENQEEILKKLMATSEVKKKSSSYSIKPSALNLGIDVFTPVFSYIKYGTSFHNYGLHTSIDFNRIFIDFDFGILRYHKRQPFELPEKYQIIKDGESAPEQYDDSAFDLNFKLGFAYNFLHKNEDRNAVFAGVGYNFAFCKNKLDGFLCGEKQNTLNAAAISTETQKFFVHWMDIVLGLRLAISKHFFLGHTTHINILKNFIKENKSCLIPYFISGYGPEENSFNLKFEFFIGYNFFLYNDPKFSEEK